jgi:hypothetical protein
LGRNKAHAKPGDVLEQSSMATEQLVLVVTAYPIESEKKAP